jgi:hypothetical protein
VYGFNRFQIWGNSFEKDLLVSVLTRCFRETLCKMSFRGPFGEYLRQFLWKTALVHNPWGAEAGNKILGGPGWNWEPLCRSAFDKHLGRSRRKFLQRIFRNNFRGQAKQLWDAFWEQL